MPNSVPNPPTPLPLPFPFSFPFPLAHIALAVESHDAACRLYSFLGFQIRASETIEQEKVRVVLASKGDLHIELLEPFPAGEGPIARFLAKKGPGLHHIALSVQDLHKVLADLKTQGIECLPGYPSTGLKGTSVAFLDPKTTQGTLIELVEVQGGIPTLTP